MCAFWLCVLAPAEKPVNLSGSLPRKVWFHLPRSPCGKFIIILTCPNDELPQSTLPSGGLVPVNITRVNVDGAIHPLLDTPYTWKRAACRECARAGSTVRGLSNQVLYAEQKATAERTQKSCREGWRPRTQAATSSHSDDVDPTAVLCSLPSRHHACSIS